MWFRTYRITAFPVSDDSGRQAITGKGIHMNNKIDFLLTWVNGNDPAWQRSKNEYSGTQNKDFDHSHYRDWDNLQYWFRGVEKFAPWVNKIHFVTCGHLPQWLNTNHAKLNIVRHSDYMPEEYLPTFSSHPIELNFHRIETLEEQFVYFNDDMFILDNVIPADFFKDRLPCDSAIMSPLIPLVPGDPFFHYLINDISVINYEFRKRKVLKKHWGKWFRPEYGIFMLKNIYHAPIGGFAGFYNLHMPSSFLKSTFEEVWKRQHDILHATSLNKFRNARDVNQYVFSYWQFASGKFSPRRTDFGRFFIAGRKNKDLFQSMYTRKHKILCINDSPSIRNFNEEKMELKNRFDRLFPEKSDFEL